MSNVVEFIYKLTDKVSGTLKTVATNSARAQEQLERAKSSANSLERSLLKLGAGYFGITQTIRGGGAFLNLGLQMEQTRAKFEVMLGSVEKGNKMIADLNQKANVTPFENEDLIKASELLLAFNYDASKLMPTLDMLGNVAMGDKNKLQGLTLAFAQMSSTGRLMGQDLLQMINQGFNPLVEISKQTGKSMAVLKKEMEDGKISSQMVEDAFRTATSEGGRFYNMMDKMSQKGLGRLSTFMGNLKQKLTEVSERITPYINKIIDFGISIVNNFDRIASVVWQVLLPVRMLAVGFYNLVKFFKEHQLVLAITVVALTAFKLMAIQATLAVKGLTIQMVLAQKATMLLNTILVKNPITAALVGISLVIGGLMMLRKRTKEATDSLAEVNRVAGQYASDERARLDMIFDRLRKTNPKSKERNELIKQLQDMYPDLLNNINLEKAGLQELETAYNNIVAAIDRKARSRAYEDRLTELYREKDSIEAKNSIYNEELEFINIKRKAGVADKTLRSQPIKVKYKGKKLNLEDAFKGLDALNNVDSEINKIKAAALLDSGAFSRKGASSKVEPNGDGDIIGSTSVSDLTGSGSKPTNITINFRNLIEYLNMYPANTTEGVNQVSDQLIEGLLRVVNSANRIAVQ